MDSNSSYSEGTPLTSPAPQLRGAALQVGAELVGVGGGEHLLHAGELAAGLQIDGDGLLLHGRLLPGPLPAGREEEQGASYSWCCGAPGGRTRKRLPKEPLFIVTFYLFYSS